jgi:hypothetical protein
MRNSAKTRDATASFAGLRWPRNCLLALDGVGCSRTALPLDPIDRSARGVPLMSQTLMSKRLKELKAQRSAKNGRDGSDGARSRSPIRASLPRQAPRNFRNYVSNTPSRRRLHRAVAKTRLHPTSSERSGPNTSRPTRLARACDGKRIRSRRALARWMAQRQARQAILWVGPAEPRAPTRSRKLRSPISQRSRAIRPHERQTC